MGTVVAPDALLCDPTSKSLLNSLPLDEAWPAFQAYRPLASAGLPSAFDQVVRVLSRKPDTATNLSGKKTSQ